MAGDKLIPLGVITGVHGVRGQVKIKSFTEIPENIIAYGLLTDAKGRRDFTLSLHGEAKGLLIASIAGVSNRTEAEALKSTELCVPRSRLPALLEGEYYIEDLIGLEVRQENGKALGEITAVHDFGGGVLCEIRYFESPLNQRKPTELLPLSLFKHITSSFAVIELPEVETAEEN